MKKEEVSNGAKSYNFTTCQINHSNRSLHITELNTWQLLFDGSSDPHQLQSSVEVRCKEDKIKIRVRHFSWFSVLLSYFFSTEPQYIQMEMLPYMHPPSVKDADIICVKVYAVREDQAKVYI